MESNDSQLKSQPTGGLKLMTVFIAVLALHVVVIGGFTVYHLMSGGSTDADLVTDKSHKTVKVASDGASDSSMPDASADKNAADNSTDKSTAAATTPATPAAPTPAPDTVASTDASSTAAATSPVTPAPEPSPAPTPVVSASTPSGPIASGPVITPAPTSGPVDVVSEPATPTAPTALDGDVTGAGTPYTVKSHDSLARIAHQHHITVAKLRAANTLKSDMLQIGQKLTIPARTETASTEPAAKASEPATAVASTGPNRTLLGDSIPDATEKPMASTSHDQAMVAAAPTGHHAYTVIKGDTLSKIAHKFHTTTSALMAANGSLDARKLRIGQKLRIPSQEPRSANVAPAPVSEPVAPRAQPADIQPRATPSAQLANFMP